MIYKKKIFTSRFLTTRCANPFHLRILHTFNINIKRKKTHRYRNVSCVQAKFLEISLNDMHLVLRSVCVTNVG